MKLYRTRTQEEYDWLMRELETVGYKWNSGEYATESKIEDENKGNIVVYVEEGEPLTFDYVKDVDAEELKSIIEVSELMKEQDPLAKKVEERNSKPTIQDRLPEELEGQKSLFENARIVDISTGEVFPEDEKVNSPSHYTRGDIEVIDIIKQLTQGYEPFEAYLVGNTIKYLARANFKENKQQDLEKAEWHINKLLEEQNK